jgi:hypothetical protein
MFSKSLVIQHTTNITHGHYYARKHTLKIFVNNNLSTGVRQLDESTFIVGEHFDEAALLDFLTAMPIKNIYVYIPFGVSREIDDRIHVMHRKYLETVTVPKNKRTAPMHK